jgi:hypothetical protein
MEVAKMVKQVRTHYGKKPYSVEKRGEQTNRLPSEVTVYYMTPEEIERYFKEKYPNLKKRNGEIDYDE